MESSDKKLCIPENRCEFIGFIFYFSGLQQVSLQSLDMRVVALCDFCYESPHKLFFPDVCVIILLWPEDKIPIGEGVLFCSKVNID